MSFTESLDELVASDRSGLLGIAPWWSRVRLGDVCSILNGFPFSSSRFGSEGGTPLIRIRDVLRGSTETHYVGEFDAAYLVRHGDLLVGMDGDFNCASWAGPDALLNQRVCKLVPDEARYPRRLLLLALPGYLAAINRKTSSITVKHLSSRTVQEIPLPLPPRHEQDQLADAIESHFSRLDAATATLERVQRNLERYRASVLKAAVEGRLVPTEAELAKKEGRSFEPASVLLKRILAERRRRWEEAELAKLKAKGKAPTDDRWKTRYEEPALVDAEHLPELPAGWCWASLDQVVVVGPQNGLYVPKSSYGRGTSIVRVDDYQDQFSRAASDLLRVSIDEGRGETYGLAVGDLLVNRVNSPTHLGKSLVVEARHVPAVFESNIMRMRVAGGLPPAFVHYYLCSLDGRRRLLSNAKWAVNQASINQHDVLTTPLPLPPAEEAARISMAIEEAVVVKSSVQASVGATLRHVARLRQSILKWAFEGRLAEPHRTAPAGAATPR